MLNDVAKDRRYAQWPSTVRELLERFRVVEHRRVGAAHSALRQLVSLQQRLWADVAESTTAVAELFADADLPPSSESGSKGGESASWALSGPLSPCNTPALTRSDVVGGSTGVR